jgi:hypothetical protein
VEIKSGLSVAELPLAVKGEIMKKKNKSINDEMLAEYEFKDGQRGKYTSRYAEGSNIVILSPDVAESFPDSESVNEALRLLIKIANQQKNISFPQ